jgi:hypothetical protein
MRIAVAALIVLVLVAGVGCGEDKPARTPLQENLAALCDQARADVEALGSPADKGAEVILPWSVIGRRLARSIGELDASSPARQHQLVRLSKLFDSYYGSLRLAYEIYVKTGSAEAYATAVDRAKPYLETAEALATRMGVPECAVRPFESEGTDDTPASD